MSAERNFTEQDYELLSAYLDGALAPSERANLETRLQSDNGLRQELEAMRQTVKLVGSLPAMKAPRNFTLTPTMAGLRQNRWFIFPTSTAFSGMAAAAATILILIGAGLFFLQNSAMSNSAPSVMQSDAMEQQAQTQLAFIPTQTTLTSEKTAEQEMADLIQATVTVPPLDNLFVTQVMLTTEVLLDGSVGSGGDGFATAPDSIGQEQSPAAASGISEYNIASATAEDQTTLPFEAAAPLGATLNPQETMQPPAQPPAAVDSAEQVGGNSEPDDSTQTNAEETGLSAEANAAVSETPSATLNRDALDTPLPASAPASSSIFAAVSSATPAPTATASPTLSQTPMPTQAPLPQPEQRTANKVESNPADFAPLILLAGFGLLVLAIITTVVRRRG